MIKVLITDDHRLVRDGFKRLLEDEPDIKVVGEANSGKEALAFVRAQKVDIVILDISMPVESGLDVLPKLKQIAPELRVLIVSMHTEQHVVALALETGANGYLSKESAAENLVEAIQRACGRSTMQE